MPARGDCYDPALFELEDSFHNVLLFMMVVLPLTVELTIRSALTQILFDLDQAWKKAGCLGSKPIVFGKGVVLNDC